jgi:hypothetical protein
MEWIGIAATAVVVVALFASVIIPIIVGEDTIKDAKKKGVIK